MVQFKTVGLKLSALSIVQNSNHQHGTIQDNGLEAAIIEYCSEQ